MFVLPQGEPQEKLTFQGTRSCHWAVAKHDTNLFEFSPLLNCCELRFVTLAEMLSVEVPPFPLYCCFFETPQIIQC